MSAFNTMEDIANRALQHCKRQRINSLSDHNESADEINFCYDKLRQAELRRNNWRFAIKRTILRPIDLGTAVWNPPAYSSGLTYNLGAIVTSGVDYWQSKVANNTGNTPAVGAFWQHYTGPDAADPYDYTNGTTYFAGELVIVPANWLVGTTYAVNDLIRYPVDGNYYVSLQAGNVGNTPSTAATFWQLYATWVTTSTNLAPPNYVGSPNVYMALTTQQAYVIPAAGVTAYISQGGTLTNLQIVYPIGTGPAADLSTRNVCRLPWGYLRQAPTDPKSNTPSSWLGVQGSRLEEDYLFEDGYLITNMMSKAFMFRYISDFIDVPRMDAMFCEGLAARIAKEVAPVLVKDPDLYKTVLANVEEHYRQEMFEARQVNSIEVGAVEPPMDGYISCRY